MCKSIYTQRNTQKIASAIKLSNTKKTYQSGVFMQETYFLIFLWHNFLSISGSIMNPKMFYVFAIEYIFSPSKFFLSYMLMDGLI